LECFEIKSGCFSWNSMCFERKHGFYFICSIFCTNRAHADQAGIAARHLLHEVSMLQQLRNEPSLNALCHYYWIHALTSLGCYFCSCWNISLVPKQLIQVLLVCSAYFFRGLLKLEASDLNHSCTYPTRSFNLLERLESRYNFCDY